MWTTWLNSLENCCCLASVPKIKSNGRLRWHLELGILKAKSLNKVDVTLSGVFISVFSPKLLIIKYEYVQIFDAFVSLNGSHLEKYNGHSRSLCARSTKGTPALTCTRSQPKIRVTKTKSLSKYLVYSRLRLSTVDNHGQNPRESTNLALFTDPEGDSCLVF